MVLAIKKIVNGDGPKEATQMIPLEHMTGPAQARFGRVVHAGGRTSAGCCGMTMKQRRCTPKKRRPAANREHHKFQNMLLNENWALRNKSTNVVLVIRGGQKTKIIENHICQIQYRPGK